mmetsp:Transcript_3227/g.7071  ORF Transcript_3227/g.7071 Transcript_3227/m.7071 type:complete len:239 (-) Transcript_3227:1066-1782(-)
MLSRGQSGGALRRLRRRRRRRRRRFAGQSGTTQKKKGRRFHDSIHGLHLPMLLRNALQMLVSALLHLRLGARSARGAIAPPPQNAAGRSPDPSTLSRIRQGRQRREEEVHDSRVEDVGAALCRFEQAQSVYSLGVFRHCGVGGDYHAGSRRVLLGRCHGVGSNVRSEFLGPRDCVWDLSQKRPQSRRRDQVLRSGLRYLRPGWIRHRRTDHQHGSGDDVQRILRHSTLRRRELRRVDH